MGKSIKWTNGNRNVTDLKPAAYNPRKWNKQQAERLKDSLDRFSLVDPIIINKDNTVIGGHFRLETLKKSGVKEVDVRFPDCQLNAEEEKELNLRLNKNTGEWDIDLLVGFQCDDVLIDVGFDIDKLFGNNNKNESKTVSFEASKKTKIKLGQHKLTVGEETTPGDVRHIIKCWEEFTGEKADT